VIDLAGKKSYIDALFFRNDKYLALSFEYIIEIYCKSKGGKYELIKNLYGNNVNFPMDLIVFDDDKKFAYTSREKPLSTTRLIILNIDENFSNCLTLKD